jgi:uncharacterized protein (TIGR02099 family)
MQTPERGRAARLALRTLEALAWTAFFGFAALFLALRFWLLPQAERYQSEVVAALSRAVGLPVKIGALHADWDGLRPRLTVTDLRVYDQGGREALVLPVVEQVVAWSSLPARELRLHSLAIEGPRLTIRRDAKGRIHVAGIALGAPASAADGGLGGGLADWILEQREIVIRNAEIEWLDEQRGAPPLALHALQFRLRNRGNVHQVGLSAQPPRALGARLDLRASLIGSSAAQPSAWNGRVYVELGTTDLAGWRSWIDYPFELSSGQGAFRLWATFGAGKLVEATADLALSGVAARLAQDLPELRLASVAGRVQGRQDDRGYEFGVRRLALVPAQGPAMHGSSFSARWDTAPPARGAVSAALVELAPLAYLAEYLPFSAELRTRLGELAPQGRLIDARFDWSGDWPERAQFQTRARFEGLGMRAWRAIPGFANLSGRFEATEARGVLTLAARQTDIDLPRLFPEPRIRLDALAGEVGWERRDNGVTVRLSGVSYANADFAGTASGTYASASEGPGSLDLNALLARADGGKLPRYLPLASIMGEKTRAWLLAAIRGGQASDVRVRLRGNLRDFPFADPALGQFEVVAQVRNGTLAFAPEWPVLEEFAGEVRFVRRRMEILGRSARSLGLSLSGARAVIASLRAPAMLEVSLDAAGANAAFLEYLRRSPVQRVLGGVPESASATGAGQLRLRLTLPLSDPDKTKVAGEYRFSDNTLRLGAQVPPLERFTGAVSFTESSIQVRNASGRFLGGPMRVTGGTQRGGSVLLSASGDFTVEGLGALLDARARAALKGGAAYAGSVRFARGAGPQVVLESSLVGVAVDLPKPLGKAAGESRLLRVALVQADDAGRDRIALSYNRLLRAELLRRREAGGMVLERAALAFNPAAGERLRLPERPDTTLVYGTLGELDLDQWRSLQEGGGGAGGDGDEGTAFDLKVGTLDAFGRRMNDIAVKAHVRGGGWRASVDAPDIAGDVTYEPSEGAKLVARMTRFAMPPESPGTQAPRAAQQLPALDLSADEFTYRGKRLGRVEIVARHDGADWRVDRLAMINQEGTLTAKGLWRTGPSPRTTLDAAIDSGDIGRFLDRIGYPGLVRRGSVDLQASLAWNGDPTSIHFPSLSGNIRLHAGSGQFLQVDPGIGKLVSLMSLQMLPRRIALDFRDVFSEGFQWDTIDATATVAQGVLETKDFRMNGGAAAVAMQGTVDLARETQDLRVRVVPGLDGTASTVAWLMVSPVVGLGTLLAQKILKNPLGQIFAYEYGIRGSWADPIVEKVGIVPEAATAPTGD